MNQEFDDLESDLDSLRPRQPSERVRRGIADRLAQEPTQPATARSRIWRIALVALALATSIAVVFYSLRPSGQSPEAVPDPIVTVEPTETTPPPTWLAYRQVLGRSDEGLDDLLDHHGVSLLTSGQQAEDFGSLYQELLPN